MKKTKVLFITPSLCQGGLEHAQIELLQMLSEDKFDITLFLYLKDTTLLPLVPANVKVILDGETPHYFRKKEAIKLNLQKKISKLLGNQKAYVYYSEKLREYIHEQKAMHPAKDVFKDEMFDVVVSYAIGISTEMALHIPAKKHYVFYHGSVDMHHELLNRLFPKYDGIIAVSTGVQDMLRKAYPSVQEKIILMENCVNAQVVLNKASEQKEGFMTQGCENITTICSCGRLSPEKGFDIAVETAKILSEEGYLFKWFFIGDGAERCKLEEMIAEHSLEDKICITGYMDNPFSLMRDCNIYVQPSYEEAYGRTIKEAMVLGRPIISTETIGAKTLIRHGENGVLTSFSGKALAEAIIEWIVSPGLRKQYEITYSVEESLEDRNTYKEKIETLFLE